MAKSSGKEPLFTKQPDLFGNDATLRMLAALDFDKVDPKRTDKAIDAAIKPRAAKKKTKRMVGAAKRKLKARSRPTKKKKMKAKKAAPRKSKASKRKTKKRL